MRILASVLILSAWLRGEEAKLYLQLGHSMAVTSVFSPDDRFVLTGSGDNTARLWDAGTGTEVRKFEGHSSSVMSVAFSPNGRLALTGSRDHTARLWRSEER